jgi:coenzyme F420-0:L-glutamate ligase/coenzyme F420-1:gamma-L-glutamate ligase
MISTRGRSKSSCGRATASWGAFRVSSSACSGVAIGCAGITAVIDDRGRSDLFGRKLEVTKRAVADNIASAAQLVMGEADECIPAVVIRGLGLPVSDDVVGVESIDADQCLFMGLLRENRKG